MSQKTKQDIKEYLEELLRNDNCRGITSTARDINCSCPFHRPLHNTTAFGINYVDEDRGFPFRCFSCGEVGNVITLIAHIYKCSYQEAQKIFSRKVNIGSISLDSIKSKFDSIGKNKQENSENFVCDLPPKFSDKKMYEYLNKRNRIQQHGIMKVKYVVSKYGLYYCDGGRYEKRVIMPIRNENGKVVYFTNRSIVGDRRKNLFVYGGKSENYLYGLYEALEMKKIVLVEGPFDIYQLKSYAIRNKIFDVGFIAIMGTTMNDIRAGILSEYFDSVYTLFDHDDEGLKCEREGSKVLLDYMNVKNITKTLYKGKDPGCCNGEQLGKVFAAIA